MKSKLRVGYRQHRTERIEAGNTDGRAKETKKRRKRQIEKEKGSKNWANY